jgi:outer membrane protein insertion porin family
VRNLFIFGILLWLLSGIEAYADINVDSIEVQGTKRVEPSSILIQVSSKTNAPLDQTLVSKDIKEIYRMGLFEHVAAKMEFREQKHVLIFQVVEKPSIRNIYLEGNEKIKDNVLKEQLGIDARRFLDAKKLESGINQAKVYYQSKGFYGTEITYTSTPVEDNQIDITYEVKEGTKKYLREIVFEGNSQISSDELRNAIKTSTYRWWSSWATGSGVVKKEVLQNDLREIQRYYLNHGFLDIQVSEPITEEIKRGLRVTFKISEGNLYNIEEIRAEGDLVDGSVQKTLDGIKTASGDVFSIDKIREDSFTISEKYTDIGYAFANVEPDTEINRENHTINIIFRINKGSLVTVNRINIAGNQKTKDNVIRRSLTIQERELFSSSKVRRSEQLLARLGYFDEVTVTPTPTNVQNEIDLTVGVREGQTGTFSAGAGVSSGDGFIFNLGISEQNLFGSGNSLTLQLDNGTRRENYILSFENPRVNDTRWSLGTDLLSVKREFREFDRNQAGGSITVGYPLWFLGPKELDDIRFFLAYELLKINIDTIREDAPQLVLDSQGKSTSSSITPRIFRNTIDNPFNPTSGSAQRLSLQLAGFGGDQKFWLGQASNTWYYTLFDTENSQFVFSHRIKLGWGETFNDDTFPLFRRFFPGGIDSVRGFDARELGPKDENGREFGGNKEFVTNFELLVPLFTSVGVKGLVFYDLGNAFDDNESFNFSDLRQAYGWGIRWSSPLGPIRIEIGYPISRKPGEDSVVTHFSFGAPF